MRMRNEAIRESTGKSSRVEQARKWFDEALTVANWQRRRGKSNYTVRVVCLYVYIYTHVIRDALVRGTCFAFAYT